MHRKPHSSVEHMVEDVSTIHSLPMFYSQLSEAIDHPRSSIGDIAKIISEDQGLTARILKLANSPLFGYFSKIDTITQAVTIIGVLQVRDLALALSVMDVFKGIPEDLVNMEQFWKHSIATGLAARILATSQREANLERFFVAGILHDIGRLVMYVRVPGICLELLEQCRATDTLLHRAEREKFGFDHADVGGALLKKWKIPPRVAEPVGAHHDCRLGDQYPRESSILHIADIIAHALQLGNSGEIFVPELDKGVWDRLQISCYFLPTLVKQVDSTYEQTVSVLFGSEDGSQ
ncbi:metal-dependent phosphohydrolase, HDOD domain-containing [Citrifermentans bemidjiense Bem]|uniref:Metal-dependent phosphohydrolase, HDOD domain-containing n=1 Tax=Citrifermentans bemidjiense (strain ATCC BAA-1014 / DSM 16622 / JCM 12645 / Bem) TaxID=404380 RepID=B5EET9_CITBB|nr:HDOD domain-containing protein [Citrifermentans bemidjiense]ACH37835.1 metal-dependent phosphohydrolase, HDOD domain-containing [Citrifermentans bemidjiense Bem]